MPSIPQSLLWISLVVLWLFVLVPMLISKREAVRRTSDVALATRVLNSGSAARLLKRGGPAAGHRSDPDWQPEQDHADDELDDAETEAPSQAVAVHAAEVDDAEPDYLDVEVVEEDSGALPVGASAEATDADDPAQPVAEDPLTDEAEYETEDLDDDEEAGWDGDDDVDEADADEYEYVEDTSGLEAEADPPTTATRAPSSGASRRRRYDSKTAAAVSARKYKFRKRMLMAMALVLVASAAAAFTVAPSAWWLCGSAAGVTVLYLAYLRRQTRIEERVRRRRMQRMARSRLGVENTHDREFDVVPSRLRRPGAAVLEIDDEDPAFEHLAYASYARDYDWRTDLPRAAGQ
ncbi:gephyrin-like molybdotransferase receptor GlpR [Mycobacterium sp. pUA109]|uniref:divisome protein SepX/GlpR n=1 Tax=Mycobacterium sp. pUA109 TaxID=3238982 RepID=UPI00351AB5F2